MYPGKTNSRRSSLTDTFRRLWEQHVMWTRSFIISTAANSGDLPAVMQRLMRNPGDFANELRKYFGTNTAETFKTLLTEHLSIAAQLVNAAKQGNAANVASYRKKWVQNADEIAGFLAGINRFWDQKTWQDKWHSHLNMTEEEAVYRLNGNYPADVALYDSIEAEALEMADLMADGISRLFYP